MSTETEDQYASYEQPKNFDPLAPELAVVMTLRRTLDANAHEFDHPIDVARRLRTFTLAAENGDLSHVRRILASQMVMLERLHQHFVRRTANFPFEHRDFERYAKLAMRAQTQMARTAAILHAMTQSAVKAEKKQAPKPNPLGMAAKVVRVQNERMPEVAVRAADDGDGGRRR